MQVPISASPGEAIRAARQAKDFERAPSRVKGGKRGQRWEEYDQRTTGDSRLVLRLQKMFAGDRRPDVAVEVGSKAEDRRRKSYLAESEREYERLLHGGRKPRGARKLSITANGQVRWLNKKGQPVKGGTVRPSYRSKGGQFRRTIATPIATDPADFKKSVDARLKRYGEALFNDRAGLSKNRLKAMRLAFKMDRERRGWAVPDWRDNELK